MSLQKTFSEEIWQAELEERAERAALEFKAFIKTVAQLRHPIRGCPWDLEQTHESLRRYMLEEAYEATETMVNEPTADLIDELGDVLLQVVLNSQLSSDTGRGRIDEVVKGINEKMIRRHPHVFAPKNEAITADEVTEQWAKIKQKEKPKAGAEPIFKKAKKVHPALTQAFQIGKTAKKIDFDWHSPAEVFDQLQSELKELKVEIDKGDEPKIAEELSDCFFSLAQLSRHLGFEPEDIAQRGNLKFLSRFEMIEALALEKKLDVTKVGQAKLEELWSEAKAKQKEMAKS
ncbi:MAG: nucleoside triphosphate pyrophosphohydrolase [Proteobacteria bacterium]|nr:MAG: nucleoside triphosphate pyrophosphohydrolase [Pseudomonadota bacterium]